ncbi:hypothetical protein [Leucobacter soli]|uniref:hypothetical protein n=1 Tax=Leucobacter soli TaxID=2812850 RepID=UPI003622D621
MDAQLQDEDLWCDGDVQADREGCGQADFGAGDRSVRRRHDGGARVRHAQGAADRLREGPEAEGLGTAKVGRTLTAKASGWSPKPSKIRYQWYRNGKAISGATKTKYRLKSADAGKKITVRVAPTRTGYAKTTRSTTVKVKS